MEEANIKIDFSYTDEFGQESRLIKTCTEAVFMDQGHMDFLVDEFKKFLVAAGWSQENVGRIVILERE